MRKTIRHPYVGIKCPYTGETIMVKEYLDRQGGKWVWQYRGQEFDNLDDVLDNRTKQRATKTDD